MEPPYIPNAKKMVNVKKACKALKRAPRIKK